jgi:hypothetical protein
MVKCIGKEGNKIKLSRKCQCSMIDRRKQAESPLVITNNLVVGQVLHRRPLGSPSKSLVEQTLASLSI